MASFSEIADENFIAYMVYRGATHAAISRHYQDIYPGIRGLSVRSVRRYCKEKGIHLISTPEIEDYSKRLCKFVRACLQKKNDARKHKINS